MRPHNQGWFRQQVQFLRRQFLQDGDLPFTDVLTEEAIAQALAIVTGWLDRIFSPLVTLWVFLGQVLSADHSCRAAVAQPRTFAQHCPAKVFDHAGRPAGRHVPPSAGVPARPLPIICRTMTI